MKTLYVVLRSGAGCVRSALAEAEMALWEGCAYITLQDAETAALVEDWGTEELEIWEVRVERKVTVLK